MAIQKMTIRKVAGQWRVERDAPNSPPPEPGNDSLEWRLDQTGVQEPQKAHFQFTDPVFVENEPGQSPYTDHWTAVIEGNAKLKLKLKGKQTRTVHYAVFIVPENEFAIGHNPPPKIDVGP